MITSVDTAPRALEGLLLILCTVLNCNCTADRSARRRLSEDLKRFIAEELNETAQRTQTGYIWFNWKRAALCSTEKDSPMLYAPNVFIKICCCNDWLTSTLRSVSYSNSRSTSFRLLFPNSRCWREQRMPAAATAASGIRTLSRLILRTGVHVLHHTALINILSCTSSKTQ